MIITLDQIKAHLGITDNTDNAVLTSYIGQIGDYMKTKIGKAIEPTAITEFFDGDNLRDTIFLGNYPVTALASLQFRTGSFSSPTWTAFSPDDYLLNGEEGTIQVQAMYSGLNNIKVVYTAGFETVPGSLQLAALKLVAKVFNKRRSDGFSHEEVAGASIDWDKFLSDDIKELLTPFRKFKI